MSITPDSKIITIKRQNKPDLCFNGRFLTQEYDKNLRRDRPKQDEAAKANRKQLEKKRYRVCKYNQAVVRER